MSKYLDATLFCSFPLKPATKSQIEDAKGFIRQAHPELRLDKYKIIDKHLPDGVPGMQSRFFGPIYIDSRQIYGTYQAVDVIAHELMHKQMGLWNRLWTGKGVELELHRRSGLIRDEYRSIYGFSCLGSRLNILTFRMFGLPHHK